MARNPENSLASISNWHRNLLAAGAIFTVLLISMGGILCVTQSIRNCPDWPGCFGRIIPPWETGPLLEYTHRMLAAVSGLLILGSAGSGLAQMPRLRWITIPPLVAVLLLLEVSYFGARVVLKGLAPGWAAVDVGSALLVVALMVTSAVIAFSIDRNPGLADRLTFTRPFSKLMLVTVIVVYILYVSGILIAGKASLSACLGWPIYSPGLFQLDVHTVAKSVRLVLSVIGIGLVIAVLTQAWRNRIERPDIYRMARWVGLAFVLEALLQIFGLAFGMPIAIMIPYTIVAAAFWALLVAMLVKTGLETKLI